MQKLAGTRRSPGGRTPCCTSLSRSFQDTNGDSSKTLRIIRRLDYLAELGVDIVWISPIYRSPQADNATISRTTATSIPYSAISRLSIPRRLATTWVCASSWTSLSTTSIEHPWFVESASSVDSERRDWYYWRDPRPGFGLALPVLSRRTGSRFRRAGVGEYDASTGQYYLHLSHASSRLELGESAGS